jgi:hypothetical protein
MPQGVKLGMRKGEINTKCEKMLQEAKSVCFIQPAIEKEHMMHHEGYTHELLGLPKDYNLRKVETLMKGIVKTPIGETFKNPLKVGRRKYLVDTEIKRHVNFALNLIKITEKRMKSKE